MIAFCPLYEV